MESFWTGDEVIRSNFASISEIQFPRAKSCRGGSLSSMAARHGARKVEEWRMEPWKRRVLADFTDLETYC